MLIALLLAVASPASAATITVEIPSGTAPPLVTVQGTLVLKDIEAFKFKVAKLTTAIVAFSSDGGNLLAGIRIGEVIRLKGFVTVVPSGARCASACATAWLGGAQRFVGDGALVGFHAAYRDGASGPTESGAANAVLGAYLSSIGLSEIAIAYITTAAPNSMTWLTLQEAAKYGIDVRLLPNATASATAPTASPPSQSDIDAAALDRGQKTWAFVVAANALWSAPLDNAAAAFAQVYADQVVYYGLTRSKSDVLADKQHFIERWPRRQYTLRAADAAVRCDGDACSVTSLVDWETWNAATAAHARGVARVEYAVAWGALGPRITLEASVVVAREKTK
jgi:hypothetical protein